MFIHIDKKNGIMHIKNNGMCMSIEIRVSKWGYANSGDNADCNVAIKLTGGQVGKYAIQEFEGFDQGKDMESVCGWAGNIEAMDFKETIMPALEILSKYLYEPEIK